MPDERVPTGIPGFDDLVGGGFPNTTVNLISGPSGAGKSLFALQFAYNGATKYDQNVLYITVEERADSLRRAMKGYGMDIKGVEEEGKFILMDFGAIRKDYHTDEEGEIGLVSFKAIRDAIGATMKNIKIHRVVVDSITAIGMTFMLQSDFRAELFRFTNFLRECNTTSILISESFSDNKLTSMDVEPFLSDSFTLLSLQDVKGELRRTLTIRKMRFTQHDSSTHPFLIMKNGIVILADEKIY